MEERYESELDAAGERVSELRESVAKLRADKARLRRELSLRPVPTIKRKNRGTDDAVVFTSTRSVRKPDRLTL